MSATTVTTLDLRVIESVLGMGSGYVLDFSDRTFSAFFQEHGVNIDDARFSVDGGSKAKRLRCFLRTSPMPLSGKVLAALLQHRLALKSEGLSPADLEDYRKLITRLGGELPPVANKVSNTSDVSTEADLLRRVFRPELFGSLPIEAAMIQALLARMEEAHRCIEIKAHLAAVILCGSVLEGMCLGFGSRHPERSNRAFIAQYNKSPPAFYDWKLREWIDVLTRLGDLSPNVEKFCHALRDFRNYVHPAEQLAHRFSPNEHTARICFQVVVAAVEDLVRAANVEKATI